MKLNHLAVWKQESYQLEDLIGTLDQLFFGERSMTFISGDGLVRNLILGNFRFKLESLFLDEL